MRVRVNVFQFILFFSIYRWMQSVFIFIFACTRQQTICPCSTITSTSSRVFLREADTLKLWETNSFFFFHSFYLHFSVPRIYLMNARWMKWLHFCWPFLTRCCRLAKMKLFFLFLFSFVNFCLCLPHSDHRKTRDALWTKTVLQMYKSA